MPSRSGSRDPGQGASSPLPRAPRLAPAALAANRALSLVREHRGRFRHREPPDFIASLAPLKTLREQTGLSVAVVDIEDIYDEYSFGIKTPYAVKDFMTRAARLEETTRVSPPRRGCEFRPEELPGSRFLSTSYRRSSSMPPTSRPHPMTGSSISITIFSRISPSGDCR